MSKSLPHIDTNLPMLEVKKHKYRPLEYLTGITVQKAYDIGLKAGMKLLDRDEINDCLYEICVDFEKELRRSVLGDYVMEGSIPLDKMHSIECPFCHRNIPFTNKKKFKCPYCNMPIITKKFF